MPAVDLDSTFKALQVKEIDEGKFEQTVVSRKIRDLPDDQLLVNVKYSSLNYQDALFAHGALNNCQTRLLTTGIDAAGVVIEDSSGQFQAGEHVLICGYGLGTGVDGGHAEYIRIPPEWACRCPEALTLREAMIYGSAGMTAAFCIEKLLQMGASPADGSIAITGASGGVGVISLALLKLLGFDTVALTGKLEQTDMLVKLGARQVIDRETLLELINQPLAKIQWAHGVDCVGGEYLFSLVKSLAYSGSVAACGVTASAEFLGNMFPFVERNINLLGVDVMLLPIDKKREIWDRLANEWRTPVFDLIAEELSLNQIPEYLIRLYNGQAIGRYIVNLSL